jgi:hypothetical protein
LSDCDSDAEWQRDAKRVPERNPGVDLALLEPRDDSPKGSGGVRLRRVCQCRV